MDFRKVRQSDAGLQPPAPNLRLKTRPMVPALEGTPFPVPSSLDSVFFPFGNKSTLKVISGMGRLRKAALLGIAAGQTWL